jgi:Kef-type K+ transport system membrane component KefB
MSTVMVHSIIAGSILIGIAFAAGRSLRGFLPEVVPFLATGTVMGPAAVGMLTGSDLRDLHAVTQVALTALMLAIGERLGRSELAAIRAVAPTVVAQALTSSLAVFAAVWLAGAGVSLALILAALAGGGAPLTVSALARSVGATGGYASRLVASHALSDAVAACAFGLAYPLAVHLSPHHHTLADSAFRFFRLGAASVLLGVALGWTLSRMARRTERPSVLFAATAAHVLLVAGVCSSVRLSLPLVALTMGAVLATITPPERYRHLMGSTRAPQDALSLSFFALAGTALQLPLLLSLGAIGLAYIAARAACKVLVGAIGARRAGLQPLEARRFAVDALPQAGTAVALALFADQRLPELHLPTIVLGSVAVFEVIGCLIATRSLRMFERRERSCTAPATVVAGAGGHPTLRRPAA